MVNTDLHTAFDTLRAFNPGVLENPSVCVAPYLDFGSETNRVILYAEQTRYDETYTSIANVALIKICAARTSLRPVYWYAEHTRVKGWRLKLPNADHLYQLESGKENCT